MQNSHTYEADTQLLELIEAVLAGEEVVISRSGQPVVRLVRYKLESVERPRFPGGWEGRVWMSDDFDEESAEVNAMFYGEAE
jgi:antitoxin (DNA-binding transcriptional repressor) of toxin-antitoxin stability system